jgi:hypothetical protein
MYHKQLVDDRVNSAIEDGLESQKVARELKARSDRTGFFRRLVAKLSALRTKKEEKRTTLSPRRSELSQ